MILENFRRKLVKTGVDPLFISEFRRVILSNFVKKIRHNR